MSNTPLKYQALDIEIKRLLDLGAMPFEIYDSIGRVSADVRATDDEVKEALALCENDDYHLLDANPWVSRDEADDEDEPGIVYVHCWLRIGDDE